MNAVECPFNVKNPVMFIHHATKSITDYVIIVYENVCDKTSRVWLFVFNLFYILRKRGQLSSDPTIKQFRYCFSKTNNKKPVVKPGSYIQCVNTDYHFYLYTLLRVQSYVWGLVSKTPSNNTLRTIHVLICYYLVCIKTLF